ncbi:NAD(P)-dependent oxidoreductase [Pontixanthobacter aestiaquae]|uniref:NAD(P)H-binding protein n=1 Tax=Pontixanthobacter aestiaquae TaxID=1509367 RepID=A0A844Z7V9_9SPHN|nr:NAD(P)-dependent oxidoreductase [Pontixanthobacter aestiaquae]MDN3646004.1 NAD(P)-dependent oxidoreductase [Pontixanthobacter aestiaquae]MXO83003.1 NAD(P)H-binding protein [Pontixanthobacter aestiaquae]
MTRTIAITGGTGFVGQAVLDAVARQDTSVRALARKVPADRPTVDWVEGNLADHAALGKLANCAEAMIHIAGLTNTPDPVEFEAANVTGTQAVIDACKAAKVSRLVFVSSLSARKPELSHYGASKLAAEKLVEASGLDWTIVRPPAVYGPRDNDMFELFNSARFGVVPLPPGGATSLIHVDDLAKLLLALVPSSSKVRRKMFEPDDGRVGGWSHKEMAQAIGEAMGRKVFTPHFPKFVLSSAAKADRLLRGDKAKLTADRVGYMCHPNWVARTDKAVPRDVWMPTIPSREGLKSTADWYRKQGWF